MAWAFNGGQKGSIEKVMNLYDEISSELGISSEDSQKELQALSLILHDYLKLRAQIRDFLKFPSEIMFNGIIGILEELKKKIKKTEKFTITIARLLRHIENDIQQFEKFTISIQSERMKKAA